MRATPSIMWILLLLSLGMCSVTSTATSLTPTPLTRKTPTTVVTTGAPTTTVTTSPTSTTKAPETTTPNSKTTTQTNTNTATTTLPVTSSTATIKPTTIKPTMIKPTTIKPTMIKPTTIKPETSSTPTTIGTTTSSPPGGGLSMTSSGFPGPSANVHKSGTPTETPPRVITVSRGQKPSASNPSHSHTTLKPGGHGTKGVTISPKTPYAPPPDQMSTSSIDGVSTDSQKNSMSVNGKTATPKTGFATSSQTRTGAPAIGASHAPAETITQLTTSTNPAQPKTFSFSLLGAQETAKDKEFAEVCKKLMPNWQQGTCNLTWRRENGKVSFDSVEIVGHVKPSLAEQYYDEMTKEDAAKPTDYKTLIAILASCGALLIMIVILTFCASHHRKPCNENQHLTEELHTVENCYHDNPTLEVMEAPPEMQEKKVALNGEFNDGWIVPIDDLVKGDVPDEEDTHL
ncbi:podocalyxin isoform X2 [Kryptolebias marmoratus]|uniref:podocalyxin isoform X2 n=1 Tax=Kryptolebias marmoratus TaxID=37003 RepID=UPI0018ACC703|nr:podocalyxin isoform X2 [Kryptolebias marmoratus]